MAVPFAKTHTALQAERKNFETREALFKLAKAFAGPKASRLMADFDNISAQVGNRQNAGSIFASCFNELPIKADIIVYTGQPVSLLAMLRGNFKKGSMRELLLLFAQADAQGSPALILFKVRHLGWWVGYNTPDPVRCSVPRLVVPSTKDGQNGLTLLQLSEFINMWNLKKGE